MKKLFFVSIFIASTLFFNSANAETFCPRVSFQSDYQSCCINAKDYLSNRIACDTYSKANTQQQSSRDQVLNATCSNTRFNSLIDILNAGKCFIRNGVIPIIIVVAVLYFLVAVFRYISEKDSKKQLEHRQTIIWGLIGLFVLVSVWGIVEILSNILGLGSANPVPLLQTKP